MADGEHFLHSDAKQPSRKERKRLAARERAQRCGTFADAVMSASPLTVTTAVASPFGIPGDVVEYHMFPFLTFQEVLAMSQACPAFDRFTRERDYLFKPLWHQYCRSVKRKPSTIPGSTCRKRLMAAATVVSRAEVRASALTAQREERRNRFFQSSGSQAAREMLKSRTRTWPSEIVDAYETRCDIEHNQLVHTRDIPPPVPWCDGERSVDGVVDEHNAAVPDCCDRDDVAVIAEPPQPRSKFTAKPPVTFTELFPGSANLPPALCRTWHHYRRTKVPKSVLYPVQFACPHFRVCFVKDRHLLWCMDCNLLTHAQRVPQGLLVVDRLGN